MLAALVLNLLVLILMRLFESRSVQIVIRTCTSFGPECDCESDSGEEEEEDEAEEQEKTSDDVRCARESSTPTEGKSKEGGDAKEGVLAGGEENTK